MSKFFDFFAKGVMVFFFSVQTQHRGVWSYAHNLYVDFLKSYNFPPVLVREAGTEEI